MDAGLEIGGYYPGLIGELTALQAVYYWEHWGLDQSFEAEVARELAEFVENFDPTRDGLWTARGRGSLLGAVAIEGEHPREGCAMVRWFIVDPAGQAMGLGTELLRRAMEFCRAKGYPMVRLRTFKGLEAARRIYLRQGFVLVEQTPTDIWGRRLLIQKYELVPGAKEGNGFES